MYQAKLDDDGSSRITRTRISRNRPRARCDNSQRNGCRLPQGSVVFPMYQICADEQRYSQWTSSINMKVEHYGPPPDQTSYQSSELPPSFSVLGQLVRLAILTITYIN